MQTKSDSSTVSLAIEEVATSLRITGLIAFWVQLAMILVSGVALLISIFGRNFSAETNTGIGVGIFWAVCGVIALGAGVYLAYRYTRMARGLRNPNPALRPKKADTVQILRWGVMVGLAGILVTLLGSGVTLGVLVAKVVSNPSGVAITDPYKIVRALDVFVALANVNGIAAHFVGTVSSLWLLDRVHHY